MHRNAAPLTIFFSIVCLAGAACRPPAPASPWLEFAWPSADSLFQRDARWVGGDGAYSIDLGEGRVLWLFGDSWIDPAGGGSRKGARMVSNTLGIQHGYDPVVATMDFHWGDDGDGPRAFFPDSAGVRYWPGHGTRIGDRLLLFLMEVREAAGGLGFSVDGWRAVLVDDPDRPPGEWAIRWLEPVRNDIRVIVGSGSVLVEDEHLLAYSAQEGGSGHDVFLARWPVPAAYAGDLAGVEWWAGADAGWSMDAGRARPVFGHGQTEFTVHRDPARDAWVQVQTAGFGQAAVVRRTAPGPAGPWSDPDTLFAPPQNGFPRIMIYQGKAHPWVPGDGLAVTYSTNSFDFADHLRQPWLYYPRFARVPG